MADSSKTEKATPKRRRDERKKGNVLMSRDAVAVATLVGSFGIFWVLAASSAERLSAFLAYCFATSQQPLDYLPGNLNEIIIQAVLVAAQVIGPILAVTVFCAVAATFLQTKFLITSEPLKPKFNRINPLQGVKRLFSLRSVVDTLKNLLKIAVLLIIVFLGLRDMAMGSSRYLYADIGATSSHLFGEAMGLIIRIAIAFIVLAAADFLYQWWEYERQLKMTKEEVKEEYKQIEGDPKVKSRIRSIQRQMAQSRMMQQVPQADVVIRNPTHFAVALRYRPEKDAAPVVLAKGQDELALRIVRVAEENKVAVIENVPLARELYAKTELGLEIPPELYNPVAEVLVYIFRLSNDKRIVK